MESQLFCYNFHIQSYLSYIPDQLKKDLCDENNIYDDEDPEKTIRDELFALGLLD